MPSNEFYDSSGYPTTGAPGSSTSMRAELDAIEAGFLKLPTMAGNGDLPVFVNAGGTALETKSTAAALTALGGEDTTKKDAPGGYAGLTLFKINFMNAIGTIKSFFTNANTAARTYTFQDRDGTIADNIDLESKANISALESKANIASPTFTGTVSGVTKAMVGLGNVDNTSDVNKPVSTAQQTALNLKAPLASPALTGVPTAPTPGATDNSTKIATTAFIGNVFAGSPAVAGYQKFSNGVVLQWGLATCSATPGAAVAVAFPLAFTTIYRVFTTGQTPNTNTAATWMDTGTTTGFNIHGALAGQSAAWLAIGYITPA